VFVVGHLGDWRVAAAVLFERESLQGNIKPSRKKREEVTSDAEGSVRDAGDVSCVGGNISPTVTSKWKTGYGGPSGSNETGNMVYAPTIIDQSEGKWISPNGEETIGTIMARDYKGLGNQDLEDGRGLAIRPHAVAQPISIDAECNARTNQFGTLVRGGEGGTQQFVAQPIAIQDVRPIEKAQNGRGWNDDGTSYTIDTKATQGVAQPIAIDWRTAQVDQGITQTLKTDLAKMSGPCIAVDTYHQTINEHTSQTIRTQSHSDQIGAVLQSMAIRRLTPKECERLQGFPDDWTKIPYRNKEADQCPDGPRYKACGNSMAVPVMRWIGQRIQYVENLMKEL
jgi:DNA (cytosine-5)-methyltransferase 1